MPLTHVMLYEMYIDILAGPSGQTNPARSMFRCSRCIDVVNVLVWSILEVPQGMSLVGTINVSTWSMFRCSQYVIARNFIIPDEI